MQCRGAVRFSPFSSDRDRVVGQQEAQIFLGETGRASRWSGARLGCDLYSYGPYDSCLCSYAFVARFIQPCGYGLYSYGPYSLYSYGLCSYDFGLCSIDSTQHRVRNGKNLASLSEVRLALPPRKNSAQRLPTEKNNPTEDSTMIALHQPRMPHTQQAMNLPRLLLPDLN